MLAVRLRISRRFHSKTSGRTTLKPAVRLRISRRFHSCLELTTTGALCCSPSHFEKVSQPRSITSRVIFLLFAFAFREGFTAEARRPSTKSWAVRLRISRRFHSSRLGRDFSPSAVRLRISRRFHSPVDSSKYSLLLFAFAFREGFTAPCPAGMRIH